MAAILGNPASGNRCVVEVDSRDGASDQALFDYLYTLPDSSSSAGEWARLSDPIEVGTWELLELGGAVFDERGEVDLQDSTLTWVVGGKFEVSNQAARVVRAKIFGDRPGESLA